MNLVNAMDVDVGELHLQIVSKHSGIEFGNDYLLISAENLAHVSGEGVDVTELSEGNLSAMGVKLGGCSAQMSVSSAPT